MFRKKDFWTHETPIHWERSVLVIPMWRNKELATKKDMDSLRKLTAQTEQKLDLILDHLKLKYVPETETKEPAKLVEKETLSYETVFENWVKPYTKAQFDITVAKKKRGRPKKK